MVYIIQFFALALYARLFTPEEFGVIASIQVFVVFFQTIADIGFGPAIINQRKFDENQRNGVFTFTALFGFSLAIAFYLFSFILNVFYGGYDYQNIAAIVCVSVFFNSLNIVPMTAMNKDVKFLRIAMNDVLVEIFTFFVVYSLSNLNIGVLALASRSAVQAVLRFSFTWLSSIKTSIGRPKFGIELYHINSILGFSLYQFGFNFINYFSRNLDNILVAKYFGMNSVGVYEKSYQLMRYPLMVTTFAMTPAIQPILTRYRSDICMIIREHNKLTSRLLALALPVSFFLYINSKNVTLILFGEQWSSVIPLIEIFSFIIPLQAVLSTSGSFFQVMNKPNLMFISGVISAVINVLAISAGVFLGETIYVALCLVVSFSINFFQTYFILFKFCFEHSSVDFYLRLGKTVLVMLLPIAVYIIINSTIIVDFNMSIIFDILANAICGVFSLIIFLSLIKRKIIEDI